MIAQPSESALPIRGISLSKCANFKMPVLKATQRPKKLTDMMRLLHSAHHAAWLLIAVGLFFYGGTCLAQNRVSYSERVWDTDDGFPIQRLLWASIIQTNDGYLWIGTRVGLVRFDGIRFETFNTDNATGILDNRITRMFESRDGSLWIATQYGFLVRYRNHVFEPIISEDPDTPDPTYVTSFYESQDGDMYVGTQDGVLRLEAGRAVPFLPELINQPVEDVLFDRSGVLWMSTPEGLFSYQDPVLHKYTSQEGLADTYALGLYSTNDGTIWVHHSRGRISRVRDGKASEFHLPGVQTTVPHYLHQDSRGRLWLSVGDTLYQYRSEEWIEVPFRADLPDLFPEWFSIGRTALGADLDQSWFSWEYAQLGEMISEAEAPVSNPPDLIGNHQGKAPPNILRDREENVWLAGFHNGLVRLRPALFETVPKEPLSQVGTADDREAINIYVLEESNDGSMWLGGLLSSLIQILPDGSSHDYGRPSAFSFPSYTVYEDSQGILWANGAYCIRNPGDVCRQFTPIQQLQGRVNRATIEDGQGRMWFGTDDGLFRFTPDAARRTTGTWQHFNVANGFPHNKVQDFSKASDGAMWIGTNGGGLIRMKGDSIEQFTVAEGLQSNRVNTLYVDRRGIVWVGLEDLGLARVTYQEEASENRVQIVSFDKNRGLFNNGINSILEDDQDRLWMSTRRGIFWVQKEELEAFADGSTGHISSTVYRSEYGLMDSEANGGAGHTALHASDGRLWFGTQLGAAVVDPQKVRPNRVPPPVVIEGVTSRLESVPMQTDEVRLSEDQRDFQISFTGLSLSAPELVRFRYRLVDYNQSWIEAGTDRSASFTQVPAGRYTFQVVAANNDGVWNEAGASIQVIVAPFFYETWWFRFLALGFLIAGVISIDRLRVRNLLNRKAELKRQVEERTQQLRTEKEKTESQALRLQELDRLKSHSFENISHEYRTPLTLIMGPLQQLLAGQYGNLPAESIPLHEMMLRHSGRLLRLTNQILDLARMDSGLSNPVMEQADIVSLLREAVQVFTPLAERNGIRLRFDAQKSDKGPVHSCWMTFDRDMIMKVAANLLSNALKFTPENGTVTLLFSEKEAHVRVVVIDTGHGIPHDRLSSVFDRFGQIERGSRGRQVGTGIGLSIVKEFTEAHGGTVSASSIEGKGTTFTVVLPKSPNDEGGPKVGPESNFWGPGLSQPSQNNWLELEPDLLPVTGEPDAEESESSDRVTLLIVDDNTDVRRYVKSQFESDYQVIEAADGEEGLAEAKDNLPDLIIADVSMPNMDGLEFNRALKQIPELACVPVILLTARATVADQIAGLATNVDEYLTKPFDPEVLKARVHSLLHIRHRLRDQLVQNKVTPVTESTAATPSAFVMEVRQAVLANLGNSDLSVDTLAEMMLMSRWQLRRRLVEEAGGTPNSLIRQVRLEEAAKLLARRAGNVSEVAYAVGFESLSHFSRSFRAHYGISPSEYQAP